MNAPLVSTVIPDNFVVQCPAKESALIKAAAHCPMCEHFGGIVQISQDQQWSKCYRILCKAPRVMKGWTFED